MINYTSQRSILAFTLITLLMVFGGCSSTDSDSDPDSDNDNNSSITFNSEPISPGGTFSYTFEDEGEIEYYCQIHAPDMQGKITVTSSAESTDPDTVTMQNDQFHPQQLSVTPNTEVVWLNEENHDHDIITGNPPSGGDGNGGY